jgi:hypothetical protein
MMAVIAKGRARADGYIGVSEMLASVERYPEWAPEQIRLWFRDYIKCAEGHGVLLTKEEKLPAKGQLTLLNEIGLFFATGTSCNCCLGWRVLFATVFGFVLAKLF